MKSRVLILGAGFGGLELSAILSERLGDTIDTTLIDRNDSFVFGFSKFEVMFGHATTDAVRLSYRSIVKPGVRFLQQTITAIDPLARRVTTDRDVFETDYLVIALGADYDVGATPGLAEAGYEFYTVSGAERAGSAIRAFSRGNAIVGVCGAPFKCPPAPSEMALLLHDNLQRRGVREQCSITLVMPFGSPVPPSPDTSKALLAAFAERNIAFMPGRKIRELSSARRVAVLDDGSELPFDLFLGIPKHVAPEVVERSGLTENSWIPVAPRTLETKYSGVYAIGDVAHPGTPKAGVFAEGAARSVASSLIAAIRGSGTPELYGGAGSCYIEFGGDRIGRVDVDFFSGPKPTGTYHGASVELRADKERFASTRRARWFGRTG